MKSDMSRQAESDVGPKNLNDFRQIPTSILRPSDTLYPKILTKILKKPPIVYYRGNISLLSTPKRLSIVGSRKISIENQKTLTTILQPILNISLVIISGLALGLDALAHTLALKNKLPLIGIPGSSVEPGEVYPATNRNLAEKIIDAGGLLLSPFAPGTKIQPYNFPIRNQLIAALAPATLVAGAAKKSGALITAQLALEYGHDVLTIPGSINDPLYEGNNILIQQGAQPIITSYDILEYFDLKAQSTPIRKTHDRQEKQCLDFLAEQPRLPDELAEFLSVSPADTNLLLSKFELRGWIEMASDGRVHLSL